MKRMILSAFLAISVLAPGSSPSARVDKLEDHAQRSFAGAPEQARVHDAIIEVGRTHGWVASDESAGKMTLSNTIRGTFKVVINVSYSPSGMQVDYVSSENLNFRTNDKGVSYIHPKYNKWVGLLLDETQAKLGS